MGSRMQDIGDDNVRIDEHGNIEVRHEVTGWASWSSVMYTLSLAMSTDQECRCYASDSIRNLANAATEWLKRQEKICGSKK